ncbi:6-carboxytetrahydropterin synthase [Staphylococcus simiae]|uniref:6-pyruvoyl trahydropterin synthase family protein n=1 Tax=Staphylococcus simiae TaxID=308354 RepID=UPI001A96A59D|nr:6-carboxytetrahydropterin synthase [Staphylococcus simiae]MBO1199860.1 6-carboxytetrahydropterin synthase [Staphylococcus simiae]MBO1202287.1 6-carboxytetrahydropterin synthase [Staphylococcus simiae]MBO1204545.1 6-carboxytetrahydropterin synthase [Staphylococcus simiae]MBO1211919.1 6-carboxytetrahydropterin synthase [Staphylococcus simiae]MBO1230712.1 6-carboxytetrahydropterin synthase [Staphylococcus simiae]
MTQFDHLMAPQHFQYKSGEVVLKQSYKFICDNRIYFSATQFKDLQQHLYDLEVDVLSSINDLGMAMDFNDIDHIYEVFIKPKLHHQLLNDTLPSFNTTAENIAQWLWDEFNKHLPQGSQMYQLQLFETPQHGVYLNQAMMTK